MIWCCRNARLHTINEQVIRVAGDHNHEPIHSASEVIEAHTKMNTAAKQTVSTTHDIVASGVVKLSDRSITSIPPLQDLKRIVQRIRQKHQNPCSLPTAHESFIIDPLL